MAEICPSCKGYTTAEPGTTVALTDELRPCTCLKTRGVVYDLTAATFLTCPTCQQHLRVTPWEEEKK